MFIHLYFMNDLSFPLKSFFEKQWYINKYCSDQQVSTFYNYRSQEYLKSCYVSSFKIHSDHVTSFYM